MYLLALYYYERPGAQIHALVRSSQPALIGTDWGWASWGEGPSEVSWLAPPPIWVEGLIWTVLHVKATVVLVAWLLYI